MQRLILSACVLVCLNLEIAKAQSNCDEVFKAADEVIAKQDEKILKLSNQNSSLKTENQEFADAIVKLKDLSVSNTQTLLLTGIGGVAVGIVVGILVTK